MLRVKQQLESTSGEKRGMSYNADTSSMFSPYHQQHGAEGWEVKQAACSYQGCLHFQVRRLAEVAFNSTFNLGT